MTQRQLLDPGPAAPRPDRRRELDAYLTPGGPGNATAKLLRRPEVRGQTLLDPSCGDGRMAQQIARSGAFRHVHLNDVHEGRLEQARAALLAVEAVRSSSSRRDAADPALYVPAPCWVISNPPFGIAGDIVRQALLRAQRGVAMLLRITWMQAAGASHKAPRGARRYLVKTPPTRLIELGRISFSGDGATDSAPMAWFIWTRPAPDALWDLGTIEVAEDDDVQLTLGGPDAEEA